MTDPPAHLTAAAPVVRRAGPADAADVVRLRDQAARWLLARGVAQWRVGEVSEADVLDWMATGRVYVAVSPEGTVVGTVRVAWEDDAVWGDQPPDAGYVHSLVVDRCAAGTGLGAALLRHADHVVRRTGRPLLRLDCWRGNAALHRYYSAAGFTEVGQRDVTDGDLAEAHGTGPVTLWERRLSPPGSSRR